MGERISVSGAADKTGLRPATIRKFVLLKQIPYIKLGARVVFDTDRLEKWIFDHAVEPRKAS